MTRNSLWVLFVSVLCCVVLVTEGRSSAQRLRAAGQDQPLEVSFVDDNGEADAEAEEYRFLSGSGSGPATANAISNLITRKQEMLEALRPQGATSTAGAANVIYVNAGATTSSTASTAANSGSIAGLLLPQVIGAAVGGGRRGAPRRRRRRPVNNRNRNQNRNRKRGGPQVFLVRP